MILYISQRFFLVKIFETLESLKFSRVCEAHGHHVIVSLCDITMHAIALCHCQLCYKFILSSCHLSFVFNYASDFVQLCFADNCVAFCCHGCNVPSILHSTARYLEIMFTWDKWSFKKQNIYISLYPKCIDIMHCTTRSDLL